MEAGVIAAIVGLVATVLGLATEGTTAGINKSKTKSLYENSKFTYVYQNRKK